MFSFIKKLSPNSRSVLYTCFYAFFCNGVFSLMMGSAMPDLKASFGLNNTMGGLFLSAHAIGNMAAGFISALVPLYLGERRSIVLLSSLAYLGFVMVILWGNPIWLFVAFISTGIGRGSVTNFDNRTVNRLSQGSPAAANLLHSSFAVGAILSPLIFLLMRTWLGWRSAMAAVVFLGCISLWRLWRMPLDQDRPDRRNKANSTLVFLKNPSFLIQAMMMFCYLCSEYAINGWLVTYIQNKEELLLGFGVAGSALAEAVAAYSQAMATLMWAVMLLGRLICAALSAKVSQKILIAVSSVGVVGFYSLMLMGSAVPVITLAVAGLGLCMAGICPMIYSDAAPFTNAYPMATSVLLGVGSIGAILMPTVVGILAERFGFRGGMSAIYVTIVLLLAFSALNVAVKTRRPETVSEHT